MSGAWTHTATLDLVTTDQFKRLILPLKDRLYRFALSYVRDADEAKDVVQEVMIKCWETIDGPSTITNLEAWCVTLCKRNALDRLKKKGRHYMQIVEQYDLESDALDPHQITQQKETDDRIRGIISQLPEKQKDAITLRDIEGCSYKEVAETMGVEVNHVKQLLHRGRAQVRSQLTKIQEYGIA